MHRMFNYQFLCRIVCRSAFRSDSDSTEVEGMCLELVCLLIKLFIEWHFKHGKGLPYGSFKFFKFGLSESHRL